MAALMKFVLFWVIFDVCDTITHLGTVPIASIFFPEVPQLAGVSFFCRIKLRQAFPDFHFFFSQWFTLGPLYSSASTNGVGVFLKKIG